MVAPMTEGVYGKFHFLRSWRAVAWLFILWLACDIGFKLRLKYALGPCYPAPDGSIWYTPAQVKDLFDHWGPTGRVVYAVSEFTLDLLFPLVYGSLFAALIGNLFPPHLAQRLALCPLLAVVADVAENAQLAYCALTYDPPCDPPCAGALITTLLKYFFFVASVVVIAFGASRRPTP
jgi:hypothetical protein